MMLVVLSIAVVAGGPRIASTQATFTVTRIELTFANGQGDITVPLRYPEFRAFGLLRFVGLGVLRAEWKVDGRLLGAAVEPTVVGEDLILTTPVLPTFEPGLHRLTLEVTDPKPGFKIPTITYFVTAEDYEDFKKRTEKAR
jgi:hypothetical protein